MVISTASKVKTFYQFSKFLEANDEKSDQLYFTYNIIFILSSSSKFIVQTVDYVYEKWSFLNDHLVINYGWYVDTYN